ncbi:interferon-induced, double-stranded RNA-activated protein kinase [Eublepharis macularius]|uniref:non-specific serine/threonine protein kinase n=1 Tax=Eublepharis macularius TaxID=481883 RepID=A0AA97J2A1_EUBMA|nr:interferon-induced, double-stranded RNA-activated protein kinase [Eublepharis macularius]XP_054829844.1 interferon-induced, double-stranded RNA-activated protein kinase [Eublepharis macularius]
MADNHAVPRVYMAKLNEDCQKKKWKMEYKDVNITGPPHDRIFTVVVVIENKEYTPATGKSKKEARSLAAKFAWDAIHQEVNAHPASTPLQQPSPSPSPPPLQLPKCAASLTDVASSPNYISLLNEYALKNKVTVQYPFKDKTGEDHKPNFFCACEIGDKIYGEGTGKNKQAAKLNAAKQAYEKIKAQPNFRPRQSADSLYTSLSSSQETSEEASMNGVDSDLECKSVNDKLAAKIDAKQLHEASSCALASPRGPAVKSKRKDTPLAPTFSKMHQRENKYTVNKRFIEEFVDIKRISRGAFGCVFKAKHGIDKREYAVKRVKLSFEETDAVAAEREVENLAELDHENIVRYYGCWIGKDTFESEDSISDDSSRLTDYKCLFIKMEFCEKGTLDDWMNQKRGTENCKDDSLMKFQQIVKGVVYIHSKNLIHRDLKPLNILISREDKIKIGDFGLVTSSVDDLSVLRTENRGTKRYMAPEQAGNRYGKEVDIFPLGLILYEMLHIFKTETEKSKEWPNIRKCRFSQTFNEDFPTEGALIKKMLSENPCDRPKATRILEILNQTKQHRVHSW